MFRAGSVLVLLLGLPLATWWWHTCLAGEETALCLVVPVLAVWIALRRRTIGPPVSRTTMHPIWPVLAGFAIYAVALLAGMPMTAMACWMATGALWVSRWTTAREFRSVWLFSFLLLFFAIPWYPLFTQAAGFPIRLWSADLVSSLFRLLQIPVQQTGTLVTVGKFAMSLEPACSGLTGLSVLLVLALVLGETNLRRLPTKILLPLLVLPASVLSNTARIFAIGMIGHRLGAERAEHFFHDFSGWMFFFVALLTVFLLLVLLQRWEDRRASDPA